MIAMFEMLVVVSLIFVALKMNRLIVMRRHDRVLFRLCDLRRDAMLVMRDESKISAMKFSEYSALRDLIELINQTTAAYKEHRTVIFNLRQLVCELEAFKNNNKRAQGIHKTTHKDIEQLRSNLRQAFVFGFMSYTPFIRIEIFAKLMVFGMIILSKLGMKKMGLYVRPLKEANNINHGKATYG